MDRVGELDMKFRVHGRLIGGALAITWTSLCTSFAGSVSGQPQTLVPPVSSNNDSLADRYFFEAKARAAEQNWEDAYGLFEKAWELKPSHDIAGNLGQVALKLGRYQKAATYLERCLQLFPPTGNADQRAQIQALFDAARRHVAAIRLHVVPQPGELLLDRVTVLGDVREQSGPIFVDPGTHVIQIRRDSRIVVDQTFMAVENAVQDVTIAQGDNSNASGRGPVPLSTPRSESVVQRSGELPAAAPAQRSKWPILIGATVAVGGFVSAAVLIHAANDQVATANSLSDTYGNNKGACSVHQPPQDCRTIYEANARADTRYNWGHAMLGLGAASLLATGTYVFWPSPDRKVTKDRAGKTGGTVMVGYTAGQAMISWLGRF